MSMGEQDPSFWEGMMATYGYQYRPIMGALYSSLLLKKMKISMY